MTLSGVERLGAAAADAAGAAQVSEGEFRALYETTARPLWAYIARVTGDRQLADDLLQETFYRFLRSGASLEDDSHRRNYLFRIATNLVRDMQRRRRVERAILWRQDARGAEAAVEPAGGGTGSQTDIARAMRSLRPRDRAFLWLAYAEGASHDEIARVFGLKGSSVKVLLFRARRRLASALGRKPTAAKARAARSGEGREGQ